MEYYQISLLLVDPQVEHCTIALPRTMLSLWAPPPHHRIRLRTTQQTHIVCLLGGVIEIKANLQNISIYKQMNKVSHYKHLTNTYHVFR